MRRHFSGHKWGGGFDVALLRYDGHAGEGVSDFRYNDVLSTEIGYSLRVKPNGAWDMRETGAFVDEVELPTAVNCV